MRVFRPRVSTATATGLALLVGVAAAARAGAPGADSCALLDPALPAALTPASVPELDALPAADGQPPVVQLPPVYVKGQRPAESDLKEEQPVGSANQPAWTATRRFPNVRIYTIPEHAIETELWVIPQWNKEHTQEARTLFEVEYGFAKHWQLDLYFRLDQFPDDHRQHPGGQIEVRYALADWARWRF